MSDQAILATLLIAGPYLLVGGVFASLLRAWGRIKGRPLSLNAVELVVVVTGWPTIVAALMIYVFVCMIPILVIKISRVLFA